MSGGRGTRTPAGASLVTPRTAAIAWAALALFIVYGSSGESPADLPLAERPTGISLPDIVQNVLLYIPFGVFGVWTLRDRASSQTARFIRVIVPAVLYSSAMELLQVRWASRIASQLDVVANALGAAVGAIAAVQVQRTLAIARETVRSTGLLTTPMRYLLMAVLAALIVVAWYPFDVTLDISTLSERTRAVRQDPWLRPEAPVLWAQGIGFFVLAAIGTACLPRLGRRAALVAALAAAIAALVIDLGQLAMGSRPIGTAAWLSQVAGACAGAGASFVVMLARRT